MLYHPFHHCCDITKDILYAARLIINGYRYSGDTQWRVFPQPLPTKAGWVSRHAVDVGFPASYLRNYEAFTVENVTTPACPPQHYATSDLNTDADLAISDSLPDACDCDDDNDWCLDGNDYALVAGEFVDTSKDPNQRPAGCNTGLPVGAGGCSSFRRSFGTYVNYPYNCRGY